MKSFKNIGVWAGVALLCPSWTVFSSELASKPRSANSAAQAYTWVVSLSGSGSKTHGATTQTLNLTPSVEKTYTVTPVNTMVMGGELFLGLQKPWQDHWLNQIGVSMTANSQAKISGDILDDGQPEFDNYTYQYHWSHTHLAIKDKLIWNRGQAIAPWVSLSLGLAFNQSRHFTNTPKIDEAVATPNFANHSNLAFTYTIGVGVQHALNQQWQLGLGYEFSDWGPSHLGQAPGQAQGQGLRQSHFYSNALVLSLSYID